jgi:small GTP-binding protein
MDDIEKEIVYKILVVGDIGTGKSCWIKRYAHGTFSTQYKSTIGVDFSVKPIEWSKELIIKLQLWDIAGQERFHSLTRNYYKDAVGAFVLVDVSRFPSTMEGAKKWKKDIDDKVTFMGTDDYIPAILIASKCDMINHEEEDEHERNEWENTKEKLDKMVEDHGFIGWVETSARDNINIEKAAKTLLTEILKRDTILNKAKEPTPNIDHDILKARGPTSGGCCS